MNIRIHHENPNDWADSMADWAEENAAELRHFTGQPWPPRRAFVPQGCDQQGRYTPTIPVAEMAAYDPEDDDKRADEKREAMTARDAYLRAGIYAASVICSAGVMSFVAGLFGR